MADMNVEGEALKKLIKIGKKHPLPFGFCLGPSDDEHIFIIHRKKKPLMLGKAARTEGTGTKIAFGTLEVSGRNMTLTCDKTVPALAKKLKRHLEREKIKMNVIVFDLEGQEVETAVEDLEEKAAKGRDKSSNRSDDIEKTLNEILPGSSGSKPPSSRDIDPADKHKATLVSRLKKAQSGMGTVRGDKAKKLKKAATIAAGQIRAGDLGKAAQTLLAIENVLDPDPKSKKPRPGKNTLQDRITEVEQAISASSHPSASKFGGVLKSVQKLISTGQDRKAVQTLEKIETALADSRVD